MLRRNQTRVHVSVGLTGRYPDAPNEGKWAMNGDFSRRQFLRVVGVGALALPLLQACVPPVPAPGAGGPAAKTSSPQNIYPAYSPVGTAPKAEFPSTGPQYDDAFDAYPKN